MATVSEAWCLRGRTFPRGGRAQGIGLAQVAWTDSLPSTGPPNGGGQHIGGRRVGGNTMRS